MLIVGVTTTLKDQQGDLYKFGPYLFSSETEKSAWQEELYSALADFNYEIHVIQSQLEPALVFFEEDVPVIFAVPAPPANYLVREIRNRWFEGELRLDESRFSMAA